MKKHLLTSIFVLATLLLFSQAKKPIIMVVPSDNYCVEHGYTLTVNANGVDQTIPDYKKALQQDEDLRLVMIKMGTIMSDRGFPLKDLEQTLKSIDSQSAELSMLSSKSSGAAVMETPIDILKRTAKADIILDLDFVKKRQGPNNYITFTLKGLDAYTNKQIAGAAGAGKPSAASTVDVLLEEAVLSHMDNFNAQLMTFFDDMFANGREVTLVIRVWDNADVDLEQEYDVDGLTDMLSFHIENWLADNTVSGRFSTIDATETMMRFEQVRIPVMYEYNGREIAMDTRRFANNLSKYLSGAPYNIDSKLYQRGLGEAWLILGEK
ncbi:MAG: hypothetical protein KKA81_07440 [Bacteroidetes bacterium]|nr:hypothetical protein [Bacteroidota bacterium]